LLYKHMRRKLLHVRSSSSADFGASTSRFRALRCLQCLHHPILQHAPTLGLRNPVSWDSVWKKDDKIFRERTCVTNDRLFIMEAHEEEEFPNENFIPTPTTSSATCLSVATTTAMVPPLHQHRM
jgi:hypothetical protein